jgi:hypothetical protein
VAGVDAEPHHPAVLHQVVDGLADGGRAAPGALHDVGEDERLLAVEHPRLDLVDRDGRGP